MAYMPFLDFNVFSLDNFPNRYFCYHLIGDAIQPGWMSCGWMECRPGKPIGAGFSLTYAAQSCRCPGRSGFVGRNLGAGGLPSCAVTFIPFGNLVTPSLFASPGKPEKEGRLTLSNAN